MRANQAHGQRQIGGCTRAGATSSGLCFFHQTIRNLTGTSSIRTANKRRLAALSHAMADRHDDHGCRSPSPSLSAIAASTPETTGTVAAAAHDQADREARDHALALGSSG